MKKIFIASAIFIIFSLVALFWGLYKKEGEVSQCQRDWSTTHAFDAEQLWIEDKPQILTSYPLTAVIWPEPKTGIFASLQNPKQKIWGDKTKIGSAKLIESMVPVMDTKGNLFVAWDDIGLIYVNHYDVASGWKGAKLISAPAETSKNPNLVLDDSGNAYLVWIHKNGLHFSFFKGGSEWSLPQIIYESPNGKITGPITMTFDRRGAIHIFWSETISSTSYSNLEILEKCVLVDSMDFCPMVSYQLSSLRYNIHSEKWGEPQIVSPALLASVTDPPSPSALTLSDGEGNILLVFVAQTEKDVWSLFANQKDGKSARWSIPKLLKNSIGWDLIGLGKLKMVMDHHGTATIVWLQSDEKKERSDVFAMHYIPNLGWTRKEFIENGTGNVIDLQLAVTPQDQVIAIWVQQNETAITGSQVYANVYMPKKGWQKAQSIQKPIYYSRKPQIAIRSNGDAWAVWVQSYGLSNAILVNCYSSAEGWGSPFRISEEESDVDSPKIVSAETENGRTTILWLENMLRGFDKKIMVRQLLP